MPLLSDNFCQFWNDFVQNCVKNILLTLTDLSNRFLNYPRGYYTVISIKVYWKQAPPLQNCINFYIYVIELTAVNHHVEHLLHKNHAAPSIVKVLVAICRAEFWVKLHRKPGKGRLQRRRIIEDTLVTPNVYYTYPTICLVFKYSLNKIILHLFNI